MNNLILEGIVSTLQSIADMIVDILTVALTPVLSIIFGILSFLISLFPNVSSSPVSISSDNLLIFFNDYIFSWIAWLNGYFPFIKDMAIFAFYMIFASLIVYFLALIRKMLPVIKGSG